ncbi:GTPase ObgE [candidate division WOR-3 bacterium]|nr:GTPase ObgE [candidate division WOR-3 bacterium]
MKKFIDRVRIWVYGGKGGNGCVSFRREKFVPRGGPDGGDGGKGGDVICITTPECSNLLHLYYKPHYRADKGRHGSGKNRKGANAKNVYIKVPPGTVIQQDGKILKDLVCGGDSFIVARGGRGGRGNAKFVSPTNQTPRECEQGEPGEDKELLLELKLIGDVGLVGYPNAGKSTFLSSVSNAKPKIASYPFTTLSPVLGTTEKGVIIADIPGIIENAHKGKGLGLEFLRHIERTKVLLFILDATRDPISDFHTLSTELSAYNPLMLERPYIIAINKMDLFKDRQRFMKMPLSPRPYLISALKSEGLGVVVEELTSFVKERKKD